MAKKAPFFSHDMNARHDPKVSAMRCAYGAEGYGWFWMLVEMMAESDGYKLGGSKYANTAYAMQLQCKPEQVHAFIVDCIKEFELFETDGEYFWSKSLRNRMQYRDAVSEKRTEAAAKRWNKPEIDPNAMQMHSNSNANAMQTYAKAMQNDANETKQNETKQDLKDIADSDESTPIKSRFVKPTLDQLTVYCEERQNGVDAGKWLDHYTANGWKVGKNPMKDWKAAVRTWENKVTVKPGQAQPVRTEPKYGVHEMTQEELELMPRG